jgi:hypothetical protein
LVKIIQKGQLRTSGEDLVYVIQYHSKKYIVDGNHRIAALTLLGKTSVAAKLLDLDHIKSPQQIITQNFKTLGVEIQFSTVPIPLPTSTDFTYTDIPLLEKIYSVFHKAKQSHKPIPGILDRKRKGQDIAEFQVFPLPNGKMSINMANIRKGYTSENFSLDSSIEGIVWHELGHLFHYKESEKFNTVTYINSFEFSKETQEEIKKKVSEYATYNSSEFVAEVYCGLNGPKKKHFDEFIMELYNYILHEDKSPESKFVKDIQKKTISLRQPISPAAKLAPATIKQILTKIGYEDILTGIPETIPDAFYVLVKKHKEVVDFAKPVYDAFRMFDPKIKEISYEGDYLPEYRYIEVGKYKIFARVKDTVQLGPIISAGRRNELNFYHTIREYLDLYENINIEFEIGDRTEFFVKNVTDIIDVSKVRSKERLKSDMNLITRHGTVPISLKQIDAPGWESPETYWGETAEHVLEYALDTYSRHLKLRKTQTGIYIIDPEVDIQADPKEAKDVIFGDDLFGRGAVIKQTWQAKHFDWDYRYNTLIVECKVVIRDMNDIPFEDYPFFQIRNFENKNPKYLLKGLGLLAVTRKTLAKRRILIDMEEESTAKRYVSPKHTLANIRGANLTF